MYDNKHIVLRAKSKQMQEVMSIPANNNQVILLSSFETANYSCVHQDSGHASPVDEYRAAESFSLQIELSLFSTIWKPIKEAAPS